MFILSLPHCVSSFLLFSSVTQFPIVFILSLPHCVSSFLLFSSVTQFPMCLFCHCHTACHHFCCFRLLPSFQCVYSVMLLICDGKSHCSLPKVAAVSFCCRFFFGSLPCFMTSDPAMLKTIMVKEFAAFCNRPVSKSVDRR